MEDHVGKLQTQSTSLSETNINNPTTSIHRISILNHNEAESNEVEELLREIIEIQKKEFLEGELNAIDFIISKYTNTNANKFSEILSLKLKVKKNFGILHEFGSRLINLQKLNLSTSSVRSVSELGSSFENLICLNLSHCNLVDLTGKNNFKIFLGLVCFRKLKFFDCSYNFINDLIELEMCNSLCTLNLEHNEIEDEENVYYLSGLNELRSLNLNKNRIQTIKNYRSLLKRYIPSLDVLDEEKFIGKGENLYIDDCVMKDNFLGL